MRIGRSAVVLIALSELLPALLPAPGGVSSVLWVTVLRASGYDPRLRERFDIVGMDRRGIEGSAPVRCFGTEAEMNAFYARYPAYPTTSEERQRVDALNDELRAVVSGYPETWSTTSPARTWLATSIG